ncbi:MAG: dual specificity protein phosphatase family protein [Spirochaetia bacterium]|nr:dual specificity protein phosphatase family protein [Spirochaetia bacterium]
MNFCFVLDDLLSASSQPGKNRRVQAYLDLYKENNIKVLVSLYKKIDPPEGYEDDFTYYHFKLEDGEIPSPQKIDSVVNIILKHLRRKEPVNVNCAAGISHSALVLIATLMKFEEISYESAFIKVSDQRYALEEDEYKQALRQYETFLIRSRADLLAR